MKHVVIIFVLLLFGCVAAATHANAEAPTEAQCQVAWTIASPDGDTLSADKSVPYVLNFSSTDYEQ